MSGFNCLNILDVSVVTRGSLRRAQWLEIYKIAKELCKNCSKVSTFSPVIVIRENSLHVPQKNLRAHICTAFYTQATYVLKVYIYTHK